MANSNPSHQYTPEEASKAGKKSKRKPLDIMLAEFFENFIAEKVKEGSDKTRTVLMFEAAYKEFLEGNSKPLAYLLDRGFGKARNSLEISGHLTNYVINKKDIKSLTEQMKKEDDC